MGLRLRLFLVLILPLTLVVGAYGLLRIRQESRELGEAAGTSAAPVAGAVQIAVENALRDRQISDIRRLVSELVSIHPEIAGIRILDRSLRPIVVHPAPDDGPGADETRRRVLATGQREVARREPDLVTHVAPLRGRRGDARGIMEIAFVARREETELWRATKDIALRIGLLAGALTALTALVLQRSVLRPLSHLMRSIHALGEGRPGPPLPVRRRDELGEVAAAFNRMADRLERARQRLVAESERTLELEQQLRQAQTLAVAGELMSGVAHEVGTPLNIISGRAEIALRSLPPEHPGRADLEIIVAQIDRISGIIRSLLDTVRLQKPEIQPVALPAVLDRLLPLLDPAARRRGVRIATALASGLPPVAADPNQLQQILLNLVMNALEATPREGCITVESWACPHDGRGGVATAVADTGVGIPAASLGRVFEPFYTTKPPGQGTGLGLAICRDLVREHGGTLTVQSREGQGTTFTMWLPEHEAAS
jgi:signal transduction histidine kinase